MRRVSALLLLVLVLLLFPAAVSAKDAEDMTGEQLRRSGVEQLLPLIPREGRELVDGKALLEGETGAWTPSAVFGKLWQAVCRRTTAPLRMLLTVCGILLLAALLDAFRDGMEQGGPAASFGAAAALSVSAALISGTTESIRHGARAIEELSYFVLSFIPVFSGVAAVAGRPTSAAVYQSVTFAAAQFFSQIAAKAVVPLLGIFLAISTVGSVSDTVDVQGIAQSVKKAACWILALCLTVFVGLLTVQSMVAGAADTVGNRTLKFVISSAVPVVGGALSEAYSSLFGCLGIVKSTIGVFGIVIMAVSLLPAVLDLSLTMLALNLAGALGDLLGQKRVSGVLRGVSSALAVMLGLILCYGMMILVSVTVVLLLGTPG